MVVYLDLIIIFTILVNYAFLKTILLLFKEKSHPIFMCSGVALAVLSLALILVPWRFVYNLRYFVGIVIGEVAYFKCHYKRKIVMIMAFYFLNLAFVGTLVAFEITSYWVLGLGLAYVIFLYMFEKKYQQDILQVTITYNVKIGARKKTLVGRSDSGNESYYRGIPIVFIKRKYYSYQFKKIATMTVSTVTGLSEIDIYEGDDLIIDKTHYLVYYSFIDLNEYDLILHKDMGVL